MCDHNTSITEYDNGTVQVELCTWGCNRIIVLEKDASGTTCFMKEFEHPELLALRERAAKADKALTRCITFLTNVNTITDDSQIELVKELIDAGRTDLADAVSIGGFGSAL